MRIDAHHLFCQYRPPAGLWPILERNRFEGSILIQPLPSAKATIAALAQAEECAFVKAVSAWVNLEQTDLDQLQRNPKFRAISVPISVNLDLREPARRSLATDLYLTSLQLSMLEGVAERAPEAQIIVAGMAQPELSPSGFDQWAADVESIAHIDTISMKLSGLCALARPHPWNGAELKPFVQHAISCFGPDRLLFGSNWPEILPQYSWKESLASFTQSIGAHSIDFREKLLGATAARLYKANP